MPEHRYYPGQFHGDYSANNVPYQHQQPQNAAYLQNFDQRNYAQNFLQQQSTITPKPPLIKHSLNAEMANSLMKQTAATALPDNALDAIKNPVDDDAIEPEKLEDLSEGDRKIETIMR